MPISCSSASTKARELESGSRQRSVSSSSAFGLSVPFFVSTRPGFATPTISVALAAGVTAGSVALVAFGLDSLIELVAACVVIWLFSGGRGSSHGAERRAQQMIAASYALLVAYIAVEAVRDLVGGYHPAVSWVGIGLAAFTAPTMRLLGAVS
jgi:divalent metal cation (Fe/Co/Zn/Cd) transporter